MVVREGGTNLFREIARHVLATKKAQALKVGNATYFVHYNEKLSKEECEKLREHITKHIPGDESNTTHQEEVIKFLEREVSDLFFDEAVTKTEIIEKVPNVIRIVHAGRWGEKVKGLFSSESEQEINTTNSR